MRTTKPCIVEFIAAVAAGIAGAQDLLQAQPPIWHTMPVVTAFEKIENGRLVAAQRAIGGYIAAQGPRTVDNTLTNYDEATALTRKVGAAQTALSSNHQV